MDDDKRIHVTLPAGILKQLLDNLGLDMSCPDGMARGSGAAMSSPPIGGTGPDNGDGQNLVAAGNALLPRRARGASAASDTGRANPFPSDIVSFGDSLIPRRGRR